jgi:hypothetical protein
MCMRCEASAGPSALTTAHAHYRKFAGQGCDE